ncbi:MAG: tRNA lysidine(34) synthetase TilS, partial [Clostridia bacterium]|nr:tRNA lysidine(34) synthetase TilS [Clostridia bacterium]
MTVRKKFQQAVADFGMLETNETVLVALSGGADSVALLALLNDEGYKTAAAHVNHMIRGDEADRDEKFCRDLCEARGITFFSVKIDVPQLAANSGRGTEETARDERYRFLEQTAKENHFGKIAVAHNATDNAETLLFNLSRGSGPAGTAGIPPCRDNVIRPLIYCSKREIVDFCKENGLKYVTDSTNNDVKYSRNRIRHLVLPELMKINPDLEKAILRTCATGREDNDFICRIADRYSLDSGRTALSALHNAVLSRVLLRDLKAGGLSPEYVHVKTLEDLLRSDTINCSVSVPGGCVFISRDKIILAGPGKLDEHALHDGINRISENFAVVLADSDKFEKISDNLKNIYTLSTKATINSAIISEGFFLRSRKDGDVIRYGGMTRKVKKLLQSRKDALPDRDKVPVFANMSDIIWIPGFPVA